MKPKRTLAGVEADHKSKGLMREANRTALWGLLGIPTFCTNTLLASLQALSHNSCCSAERHPQLAEIRILFLFHISTAERIGLSENTHPLMSWVESLVWNAGSKRWFTQEGEDMQLLVPKNDDSPIFNVIFLWLGFFFYLRLKRLSKQIRPSVKLGREKHFLWNCQWEGWGGENCGRLGCDEAVVQVRGNAERALSVPVLLRDLLSRTRCTRRKIPNQELAWTKLILTEKESAWIVCWTVVIAPKTQCRNFWSWIPKKWVIGNKSMVANWTFLKGDILKLFSRNSWSSLPLLYINPVGLHFICDTQTLLWK